MADAGVFLKHQVAACELRCVRLSGLSLVSGREPTHLSGFQRGPAVNKGQVEKNNSIILISYRTVKN